MAGALDAALGRDDGRKGALRPFGAVQVQQVGDQRELIVDG
jgi:hypothetical protein